MEDIHEHLRYPVGKQYIHETYTIELRNANIQEIKNLPIKLNELVEKLSPEKLANPYRPDGWTGNQVIHHLADSHMNCLMRLKLALTENAPVIKPYIEQEWAKLSDYNLPIQVSLSMIESIHLKLGVLLDNMKDEDFERTFTHPQYNFTRPLHYLVSLYAWHGRHHLGHLSILLNK
jgi:hypothetical protein